MGGNVLVGRRSATVVEGVGAKGCMGLSGVGGDVVVDVGLLIVVEPGKVGDRMRHVGVGGTGEGSVVDVEGDTVRDCPSGIGVRGRVGWWRRVGRTCRRSRRRKVREKLWYWG